MKTTRRKDALRRRRFRLFSRAGAIRLLILFAMLLLAAATAWFLMIRMPGKSHRGALLPLSADERVLEGEVRETIRVLATDIGERHVRKPEALARAARYLREALGEFGYTVAVQSYEVVGVECQNIEVELTGTSRPDEIVVVGAHYDSVVGCPAANDNASGVAALLALASRFAGKPRPRTLRFVAFVNEEPPHFQHDTMGSSVYAARCRERDENIVAMLSLETLGFYVEGAGSQNFPLPLLGHIYPDVGNYVAFVGDFDSRALVRRVTGSFRRHASFPSEGAALPGSIAGVGWSDHWSFWQHGYPALMATDTAPFRYPHYHRETDTPDRIDHARLARVTAALQGVLHDLTE